ncbi:MAG TPA: SDR family oxidoreductase [Acidimicrobiales bacterium]|nr:SDR family oxidoreductase [Acidimicrobiales bacterium]
MAKDTDGAESRIALITGASSGIGAALARELARRGMTVGIVARRHDRLVEVLEACRVHAPASQMWAADLSDPAAAAELALTAWDAFGHIDILVNNAGVPLRKTIPHITAGDIERVMRINFLSSTAMTLALIPRMLARATGTIVNVASIAGRFGVTTEAAYSASKFAMCGWSEGIAADMAGTGVTVKLILPGTIDTELWDQPDNDPPLYQGDLVPAEETAAGIADAIDDEHFEHFLPDMKAVVEAKVADIDKFMAGMVAFHRSQKAAAQAKEKERVKEKAGGNAR